MSNTISRLTGRGGTASVTVAHAREIARLVGQSRETTLPDRVLTAAINSGLAQPGHVPKGGSWRRAAAENPDLHDVLHRLAADTYGYRKIMICEMSTVVQADLLTVRLSSDEWERLFSTGIVPVVEHGRTPLQDGRVTFASHDPGNPDVRTAVEQIRSVKPRLVYADLDIVHALQGVMMKSIPMLGGLSTPHRPALKKVRLDADNRFGRAA